MTLTALLLAIISKTYSLRLKSAFTLAKILLILISRVKGFETIARCGAFSVVEKPFTRRMAFALAEVLIDIVSDLKQTFYFRDDSVSRRQERVRENKMFAFAFTLAEVLIVLGIIGLVADMTIPTLFNKIDKQVNITMLKKSYSTINQAYTMIKLDYGDSLKGICVEKYLYK